MPESLGTGPKLTVWLVALLLVIFLLIPFFGTAWKSTLQLDPARPNSYGEFIGGENYRDIFWNEPEFSTSLIASAKLVALTTLQCVLACLLAALFYLLWPRRLPTYLVLLLVFPLLISPTIVALMGRLYLNDQIGVITKFMRVLHLLGADEAPLGTSTGAWFWIAVIDAWQWVPFTSLLFWLCLRLVPERQLEASRVDGLRRLYLARYVILPNVVVPASVVVLFRMLEALRAYDLPQVLTGGGPGTSTLVTSIYATRITFTQQRFSMGAAHLVIIEVIAYVIIMVLASRVKSLRGVVRKGAE